MAVTICCRIQSTFQHGDPEITFNVWILISLAKVYSPLAEQSSVNFEHSLGMQFCQAKAQALSIKLYDYHSRLKPPTASELNKLKYPWNAVHKYTYRASSTQFYEKFGEKISETG